MIVWLRRSRVLRLLLVAFMVPLMVVTSGSGARAAATSEARIFTLEMPRAPDIACGVVYSIGGGLGGGTFQVQSGGWCEQKSIPEWGAPDITSTEFSITVKGMHEDGAPTEWNLSWSVVGHEDGFFSDKALMGSPSAPVAAGWDVHEVCVKAVDRFGFDTWAEDCQASSLAAPDGGATCDLASLTSVERTQPYVWDRDGDLSRGWAFDGVFTYTLASSEAPRADEWVLYYLLRHSNGDLSTRTRFPLVASDAGGQMSGTEVLGPRQFWSGPAAPMDREVIGVGMAHVGDFSRWGERAVIRETGGDIEARLGVHDPSRCLLYMGEKVWDDGQPGGSDEPTMPLPPAEGDEEVPPDVPDVPDSPSGDDPWWMSLLGLLWKIINAIISLPVKIVGLLGDLLRSLFIPSDGFLDDGLDELRDQADDSNIGEWNDAFSGLFSGGASGKAGAPAVGGESLTGRASATAQSAPSGLDFGGGGCEGPSVDIARIIPEGMGSEMNTIHPFAACEGITAEMAGWSRLLSSLFLALFGGFKMFGYVASASFGMKQTEIMRDHDWQSGRLDGRSL